VHGAPAIAMAVDRYVTVTVTREQSPRVMFDLSDLTHHSHLSIATLKKIKNRIKGKYQRFINGEYSIRQVLHKPFELAQFALGLFTESFNLSLPHGVKIHVQSDIPIGCGMGSSAATILSVMHAISTYLQVPISAETLYKLALEAENMQHGFSSGLDLRVAMQGGCLYMHGKNIEIRPAPTMPMYLVNSGVPITTTGQCVESVAIHFQNTKLRDEFARVTNAIDAALLSRDMNELQKRIQQNHQLLVQIGVVPVKVQQFISDIESVGGAAKICGAGAVAGEQAGVILVFLKNNDELSTVCQRHGYTFTTVAGVKRGVHAV